MTKETFEPNPAKDIVPDLKKEDLAFEQQLLEGVHSSIESSNQSLKIPLSPEERQKAVMFGLVRDELERAKTLEVNVFIEREVGFLDILEKNLEMGGISKKDLIEHYLQEAGDRIAAKDLVDQILGEIRRKLRINKGINLQIPPVSYKSKDPNYVLRLRDDPGKKEKNITLPESSKEQEDIKSYVRGTDEQEEKILEALSLKKPVPLSILGKIVFDGNEEIDYKKMIILGLKFSQINDYLALQDLNIARVVTKDGKFTGNVVLVGKDMGEVIIDENADEKKEPERPYRSYQQSRLTQPELDVKTLVSKLSELGNGIASLVLSRLNYSDKLSKLSADVLELIDTFSISSLEYESVKNTIGEERIPQAVVFASIKNIEYIKETIDKTPVDGRLKAPQANLANLLKSYDMDSIVFEICKYFNMPLPLKYKDAKENSKLSINGGNEIIEVVDKDN